MVLIIVLFFSERVCRLMLVEKIELLMLVRLIFFRWIVFVLLMGLNIFVGKFLLRVRFLMISVFVGLVYLLIGVMVSLEKELVFRVRVFLLIVNLFRVLKGEKILFGKLML